jgi:hypothetical protein
MALSKDASSEASGHRTILRAPGAKAPPSPVPEPVMLEVIAEKDDPEWDQAYWRLPGPALWLDAAAKRLSSGLLVLDIPRSRRHRVELAFEAAARRLGYAQGGFYGVPEENKTLPPASMLIETVLLPQSRPSQASAGTLVTSRDMDGAVIWAELDEEAMRRMSIFAGAFLQERAKSSLIDPPSLVILADTQGEPPVLERRVSRIVFEGVVDRGDVAVVLAGAGRARAKDSESDLGDLEGPLKRELITELCGWDLDLARRLSGLELKELLDPAVFSRRVPGKDGVSEDAWRSGSADRFEGRTFPSLASLLQAGESKEVEMRIWRAQIRAVYPWLEAVRQEVIDLFRGRFRLPLTTYGQQVISEPEDLDWGQVEFSLRGSLDRQEKEWIEAMKTLRNQLAHRRPAAYAEIAAAERYSRKQLVRRPA